MVKANIIHYKDLLHEIKYVIDTKYDCSQMKPDRNINRPWELCGYSDADYAGDNSTRKVVTGYIVLVTRSVIACFSLNQKTVTLSVIEYEYS